MSAAKKVVVILGAGPKVGLATASKFQAAGYTVAVGSRKPALDELRAKGLVPFRVDLSDPVSVPAAFDTVVAETGAFPEVIIYNGVYNCCSPDLPPAFPLSFPLFRFISPPYTDIRSFSYFSCLFNIKFLSAARGQR